MCSFLRLWPSKYWTGEYVHSSQTVTLPRSAARGRSSEARTDADEALGIEPAEHIRLLAGERSETDKDVLSERTHFDATLAKRDDFLAS
jgi:hypothetical protein